MVAAARTILAVALLKHDGHVLAAVFTRLRQTFRDASSRLSLVISPSAILRRVGTSVVDSIQRCAVWARPHVGSERVEVVAPASANRDALSAVPFVARISRVQATLLHTLPRRVFRRQRVVDRGAVRRSGFRELSTEAAAALRRARSQMCLINGLDCSAVAAASPARATATFRKTFQHGQSRESLADHNSCILPRRLSGVTAVLR